MWETVLASFIAWLLVTFIFLPCIFSDNGYKEAVKYGLIFQVCMAALAGIIGAAVWAVTILF